MGEGANTHALTHMKVLPLTSAPILPHMVLRKVCAHMLEAVGNIFRHLADGVSAQKSTGDLAEQAKRKADSDTAFHHAIQNGTFTEKGR